MNKSYRIVFNESTGTWTAVAENAKGRKKSKSCAVIAAVSLGATVAAPSVMAGVLDGGAVNPSVISPMAYGPGARVQTATSGGDWQGVTNGASAIAIGNIYGGSYYTIASGLDSLALGNGTSARGQASMAIGVQATAFGYNSQAIGSGALASTQDGMAVGHGATAGGLASTALGSQAKAASDYATAVGRMSSASGNYSLALGTGAMATNDFDVALGANSTTSAVVNTTSATIAGTTYTFAGTSAASTVSVGARGSERTVTNVAAGRINSTSTDAINGSQLYATNSAVNDLSTRINNINTGGSIKYFHANSTGTDSSAVGVDSVAIGMGAVANNKNDVALGANSTTAPVVNTTGVTIGGKSYTFAGTNATSTVSVGSKGNERTITNVAAGRVTSNSTDAINGSQLYATNTAVDNVTNSVNTLSGSTVKYDTYVNGATNYNSITLGGNTYNSTTHTGGTKIINVADGTNAGDAVNYSQLTNVNNSVNNI